MTFKSYFINVAGLAQDKKLASHQIYISSFTHMVTDTDTNTQSTMLSRGCTAITVNGAVLILGVDLLISQLYKFGRINRG